MSNVLKYNDCESSTYECQLTVILELYVNYEDRSTLTDTTISNLVTSLRGDDSEMYLDCTDLAAQMLRNERPLTTACVTTFTEMSWHNSCIGNGWIPALDRSSEWIADLSKDVETTAGGQLDL